MFEIFLVFIQVDIFFYDLLSIKLKKSSSFFATVIKFRIAFQANVVNDIS